MNALQKALAKIPVLKPGMPWRDAFTSEGWNAMRDALFAVVRGEQIQRSGTVRVRRFPEGYSLWANPGGDGAGGGALKLFQIYDASTRNDEGEITAAKVRLVSSLLAQDVPTTGIAAGIDVVDGDKVYAHVAFNTTTGAVTGRTIAAAATVPADSSGNTYLRIGSVAISGDVLTPSNDVYGPIEGCRKWFVSPLAYELHGSAA